MAEKAGWLLGKTPVRSYGLGRKREVRRRSNQVEKGGEHRSP
jgi:hypothetical protein